MSVERFELCFYTAQTMKWLFAEPLISALEAEGTEASIEESMGIDSQIQSKLLSVRTNVKEEESTDIC